MGVREYFLAFFGRYYSQYGGSMFEIQILAVSLTIMACNIILPAIPGMILFYFHKFNAKEMG
jgi:hypothetical protein